MVPVNSHPGQRLQRPCAERFRFGILGLLAKKGRHLAFLYNRTRAVL